MPLLRCSICDSPVFLMAGFLGEIPTCWACRTKTAAPAPAATTAPTGAPSPPQRARADAILDALVAAIAELDATGLQRLHGRLEVLTAEVAARLADRRPEQVSSQKAPPPDKTRGVEKEREE